MNPRMSIMLPITAAAVISLAEVMMAGASLGATPTVMWTIVGALIVIGIVNFQRHLRSPLQKVTAFAAELAQKHYRVSEPAIDADGDFSELARHLLDIRESAIADAKQLDAEAQERAAQTKAMRELTERYTLVVERANDGIWEWDIEDDAVTFSARWDGMHGYSSSGPVPIAQWKALIHPADRDEAYGALMRHTNGQDPYFDVEYRMTQKRGTYLWVHARGVALRHASGKPYRVIVMENDIDERKQLEQTLIEAAEGLSSVSGIEFYRALIRNLSGILGTRDNMICRTLDDPPTRAQAIAYFTRGEFKEPFEYELAGTSCGEVIKTGDIVFCPDGVTKIWPLEAEYDRESYIGIPMFDSNGKVIGHFACMDGKPMSRKLPHLAIFKIFSVRAAAELERTLLKEKLDQQTHR